MANEFELIFFFKVNERDFLRFWMNLIMQACNHFWN